MKPLFRQYTFFALFSQSGERFGSVFTFQLDRSCKIPFAGAPNASCVAENRQNTFFAHKSLSRESGQGCLRNFQNPDLGSRSGSLTTEAVSLFFRESFIPLPCFCVSGPIIASRLDPFVKMGNMRDGLLN